jgi:hypothetical protein
VRQTGFNEVINPSISFLLRQSRRTVSRIGRARTAQLLTSGVGCFHCRVSQQPSKNRESYESGVTPLLNHLLMLAGSTSHGPKVPGVFCPRAEEPDDQWTIERENRSKLKLVVLQQILIYFHACIRVSC